jgi:hypothetical protein
MACNGENDSNMMFSARNKIEKMVGLELGYVLKRNLFTARNNA